MIYNVKAGAAFLRQTGRRRSSSRPLCRQGFVDRNTPVLMSRALYRLTAGTGLIVSFLI